MGEGRALNRWFSVSLVIVLSLPSFVQADYTDTVQVVDTLRALRQGTTNQWTPVGAGTNWQCVEIDDNTTTEAVERTLEQMFLFSVGRFRPNGWTKTDSLRFASRLRKEGGVLSPTVSFVVRINATHYESDTTT